ncbi:MAG: hypothetical protein GY765_37040 [bacterium]|nr:hypothetical protein [bacterium]
MRRKIILIVLLCMSVCLAAGLSAQEEKQEKIDSNEVSRLFDSDEILDLVLEYEVNAFKKDRGPKRGYHKAKLSYIDQKGQTVGLDVQIKVRGKLRRQLLNCLVPPIKIKFDKTQTPGTLFEKQTKLKTVVHCKNSPKFFENYTKQEYLVYKIYNLLTDKSFRVRMARITYTDVKKKKEPFTKYAFFLESYKELAARIGGKTVKDEYITLEQANYDVSTLLSVFEYMVGNTDWSIRSVHNIKLVRVGDSKMFTPVPFDFDQTGLINAHYARPDELLTIKSVRERLFRGYCKKLVDFKRTFVRFKQKKKEILDLFRDFEPLSDSTRKRNLKYLESFYKIIDNPKLVKRYFINNYRGRPRPLR